MARHIIKRHRTWFAVLDVPAAVRDHFGGRAKFCVTLETHSEAEALRRAPFVVAEWRAQIAEARGTVPVTIDPLEADVQWVKKFQAAERAARDSGEGWVYYPDDDERGENPGADAVGDMWKDFLRDMDHRDPKRAEAVYKRATGEITPTALHLDEWLARSNDTPKNKDLKRADVMRLAKKFSVTREITKKAVRRWRDQLPVVNGWKASTVALTMSSCRGYWKFLQQIEAVPEDGLNPFSDLPAIMKTKVDRNSADDREPFSPEDVVRILGAAEGHQPMVDLIRLAMWSGARIGELCALKVEAVDFNTASFKIVDAKTKAGVREVPIHASLQATLERLVRDSGDGYVLAGQSENRYGSRTAALATRFSRLKRSMGFGTQHNFHSIRRTVSTLLENAGVREGIAADIIGHAKKTMTYGLYSGGFTLEIKAAALARLSYPVVA